MSSNDSPVGGTLWGFRSGLRPLVHSLRQFSGDERFVLLVLAVVLGLFGGYLALAFREGYALLQQLIFAEGGEQLIARARSLEWWHLILAPTLGGVGVGLINHYLMGGRRAQGVANIIECAALHNGDMPLRNGLVSALASMVSVGVGASVGREGAILHLTTTLASALRRFLKVSEDHTLTLLGCGVASAVAASFNAPIAGVFFALEVVIGNYALKAFAPVVLSSVIGTIITRTLYGDFPAFILPHYEIVTFWEFPAFVLLGVVIACAAMAFMWSVFFAEDTFDRLRVPVILRPACAGLIIGTAAIWYPEILSVGYEVTDAALNQELPLAMLVLLALLKGFATATCVGGRFGGGVFSPALFLGAMTGGAFGIAAAAAVPGVGSEPGLYAIVGMAAMAAAVAGSPIAAILMVFELLGDFKVTVAVMSGAAVAFVIVQGVLGVSYYTWQHKRKGIVLSGGRARQLLKRQRVGDVMEVHFQIVPHTMKLNDIKQILHLLPEDTRMFVVDGDERLIGTVSMDDIKDVAFDPLVYEDGVEAGHVARDYPEYLLVDATLEDALDAMERWNTDILPVITSRNSGSAAGLLDRNTVLAAYNKALLQAEAEKSGR